MKDTITIPSDLEVFFKAASDDAKPALMLLSLFSEMLRQRKRNLTDALAIQALKKIRISPTWSFAPEHFIWALHFADFIVEGNLGEWYFGKPAHLWLMNEAIQGNYFRDITCLENL